MRLKRTSSNNILVISKNEWTKIGRDAKWIKKTAEKDTVTVRLLNRNVTFHVGHNYTDAAGNYVVNSISDDEQKMKVTYLDGRFQGETKEYSVPLKAGHYVYILRQQEAEDHVRPIELTGDQGSWVFGYLAAYGKVTADVPGGSEEKKQFEDFYKKKTGDNAQDHAGSDYYVTKPGSKWHLELRIHFPKPPPEYADIVNALGEKVIMTESGMEINNNNFIKNLIRWGFKLGRNANNIDAIASKIPEIDMDNYIKGSTALD